MKKCSYCAEEIQDEAIMCRFCGRDLTVKSQPVVQPSATPKLAKNGKSYLWVILLAIVGVVVLMVLKSSANNAKTKLADDYRSSFSVLADQIANKMTDISVKFDDASKDTSLYKSSTWKKDFYSDIDRITDLLNQADALEKPEGFTQTSDYLQKSIEEFSSFSSIVKDSIDTMNVNKFSNAYPRLQQFMKYFTKAVEGLSDQ